MKLLHKLRGWNLDAKMVICTEVTRTLVWVANRMGEV